MAINIQEQFNVNIGLPIDSRIVASGSAARSAITYKYDGLLVYDTGDRKTYVWNANNSSWSVTDITGVGTTNAIPKWSSSTGLTSSGIYMIASSGSNGKVGINTSSPNEVLQVNSISGGSQPFVIHKGTAHNIIGSNWYNTGSDQYFSGTVGSAIIKFLSSGEIAIHNRSNTNFTPLNSGDTFNTFTTLLFGPDRIGLNRNTYFSNNSIGNIISSAYIRALYNFSTKTTPDYTWWNDDMTGIYHPSDNKIGFSVEGEQKALITLNGLAITATDNVTSPASRIHVDGGNSVGSAIQFTAGTLTGVGSAQGVLLGIGANGSAVFQSRYQNSPYLFVFTSGNSHHAIRRNKFVTYSGSNGENSASVTGPNGGDGSRSERISWEWFDYFTGPPFGVVTTSTINLGTTTTTSDNGLKIPSNSSVSIDVIFNTSIDPSSGSNQYKTQRITALFRCDSSGNVTLLNKSTLYTLNSSSSSGIGNADVIASTSQNLIEFTITSGSGVTSNYYIWSILDIVAVFNVNVGS